MILIHVTTADQNQAIEISNYLVSEKLILDALITEGSKHKLNESGAIIVESHFLVLGKTKALLFDQIDDLLRKKYPSNMPTLYSVPIVNMDWDQASDLKDKTEKV